MTGGALCLQHVQLLYSCCIAFIVVQHAAHHRVALQHAMSLLQPV